MDAFLESFFVWLYSHDPLNISSISSSNLRFLDETCMHSKLSVKIFVQIKLKGQSTLLEIFNFFVTLIKLYLIRSRRSCKRLTNPARLILSYKKYEVLARKLIILQDFNSKILLLKKSQKILQVLQDNTMILQDGFYWKLTTYILLYSPYYSIIITIAFNTITLMSYLHVFNIMCNGLLVMR